MYMGIDTGGSKTAIAISDDGLNISERIYGPGVGKAADTETPDEELLKILMPLSKYKVDRICVNLGGKNVTQIKNTVQKLFPHSEIRVYRESSGTLPLYVLKKRNSDIILLAGTGTIAIGKNGDKKYIGGGWGCDIGDEGSGYWIGKQAVIRSLKALDGIGVPTTLCKEILNAETQPVAKTDPEEITTMRDNIRKNLLPVERSKYASYTKTVANCAEKGDSIAKEIFEEAGRHMADLVCATAQKSGLTSCVKLTVMGGLTNIRHLWLSGFEKTTENNNYKVILDFPDTDLSMVAVQLVAESEEFYVK